MATESGSASSAQQFLVRHLWWWLLGTLALARRAATQEAEQVVRPPEQPLADEQVQGQERRIYITASDALVSGKKSFHVAVQSSGFGGKGAWLRITDTRDKEPGLHHEPDRDLRLGTFTGDDAFVVDIPRLQFLPTEFRVYCADYIRCRSGEVPYVNCIYPFARSTNIAGLVKDGSPVVSNASEKVPGVLVVVVAASSLGCLAVLGWKCQASKQLRDLTFSRDGLDAESGAENNIASIE